MASGPAFEKAMANLAFEAGMRFHAWMSGAKGETWEDTWADISYTLSKSGYPDQAVAAAKEDTRNMWESGRDKRP